jgi:hypothetical protein
MAQSDISRHCINSVAIGRKADIGDAPEPDRAVASGAPQAPADLAWPATHRSVCALVNPRTSSTNISFANPCARISASLHPACGAGRA